MMKSSNRINRIGCCLLIGALFFRIHSAEGQTTQDRELVAMKIWTMSGDTLSGFLRTYMHREFMGIFSEKDHPDYQSWSNYLVVPLTDIDSLSYRDGYSTRHDAVKVAGRHKNLIFQEKLLTRKGSRQETSIAFTDSGRRFLRQFDTPLSEMYSRFTISIDYVLNQTTLIGPQRVRLYHDSWDYPMIRVGMSYQFHRNLESGIRLSSLTYSNSGGGGYGARLARQQYADLMLGARPLVYTRDKHHFLQVTVGIGYGLNWFTSYVSKEMDPEFFYGFGGTRKYETSTLHGLVLNLELEYFFFQPLSFVVQLDGARYTSVSYPSGYSTPEGEFNPQRFNVAFGLAAHF